MSAARLDRAVLRMLLQFGGWVSVEVVARDRGHEPTPVRQSLERLEHLRLVECDEGMWTATERARPWLNGTLDGTDAPNQSTRRDNGAVNGFHTS